MVRMRLKAKGVALLQSLSFCAVIIEINENHILHSEAPGEALCQNECKALHQYNFKIDMDGQWHPTVSN